MKEFTQSASAAMFGLAALTCAIILFKGCDDKPIFRKAPEQTATYSVEKRTDADNVSSAIGPLSTVTSAVYLEKKPKRIKYSQKTKCKTVGEWALFAMGDGAKFMVCSENLEWVLDEKRLKEIADAREEQQKKAYEAREAREKHRLELVNGIVSRILSDKEMTEFVERGPDILDSESSGANWIYGNGATAESISTSLASYEAGKQKRFDEIILQQYRLRGLLKCEEKCASLPGGHQ